MEDTKPSQSAPWAEPRGARPAPWEPSKSGTKQVSKVEWDGKVEWDAEGDKAARDEGDKGRDDQEKRDQTWLPQWDQEGPGRKKARLYPTYDPDVKEPGEPAGKRGGWWERLQRRVARSVGDVLDGLRRPERAEEEGLRSDDETKPRKKITPSNYSAMEIHGFFGLVDDGPCGQGRMLICHVPSWVRGQAMDVKDGDRVHVWNVNGRGGGVLDVVFTGRHRYYSPGAKITTCTICVPEEQWARVLNWMG